MDKSHVDDSFQANTEASDATQNDTAKTWGALLTDPMSSRQLVDTRGDARSSTLPVLELVATDKKQPDLEQRLAMPNRAPYMFFKGGENWSPPESGGDNDTSRQENGGATTERKNLEKLSQSILDKIGDTTANKEFKKALDDFIKNRSGQIGEKECGAVLKQLDRLLTPENELDQKPRLTSADRQLLAKQCLQLATIPHAADQGRFNTCELATIEKVLWAREPSAVAKCVADAAMLGSVKNYSGQPLKLSDEPFRKNLESATTDPKAGHRLFCSQIFQTALVEREWADRDIGFGKGGLSYKLKTPDGKRDSGERFVDQKGRVLYDKDDKVPISDPGIDFTRMPKIYNSLASKPLDGATLVLCSTDTRSFLPAGKLESMEVVDRAAGLNGLDKALQRLKDNKLLPVIAVVADVAPNGDRDLHVVTISGYNSKTRVATIDDQFGPDSKQERVSLAELQKRMTVKGLKPWQLPKPSVYLKDE